MSGSSWRNDLISDPTKEQAQLPTVVIVGRPNVGKSTLFNRLLGKRKAITHTRAGVTRDPVRDIWRYKNREVILIDTAGIRSDHALPLDALGMQKSVESLQKADGIILTTSLEGITGEDEELMDLLRPFTEKVILAVNKVDAEEKESGVGEFFGLGFGDPIPLSAIHNRACDDLAVRVFNLLEEQGRFHSLEQETEPREAAALTLAVLGKPNTGKSTLVNTLLGKEVSIVSEIPGTTRDVVEDRFEFKGRVIRILDTAGIRRKAKVREDVEYYSVHRALRGIREADVVFLLLDAEEGLSDQDKKITDQVVKRGRGIIIVVNKWDKIQGRIKTFTEVEERIRFQFPMLEFAPIIPISAITGWNVDSLVREALTLNKQLHTRIETSLLNRALEQWMEMNPPPEVGRKKYKVRFITQVRAAPVRFVLFVNRKDGFPGFYAGYIRNKIREEFKLSSIPIEISLRSRVSIP